MELLPEEKLVEICEKLDDFALARFVQTSKENQRICGDVQRRRELYYNHLIDETIDKLKIAPIARGSRSRTINLESTDVNTTFIVSYLEWTKVDGTIRESYDIQEKVKYQFKLNYPKKTDISNRIIGLSEDQFRQSMLKLFHLDALLID